MYKKGKGRLLKSDRISAVSLLEGRSKDFLPQSGIGIEPGDLLSV
ncbi:hypothetical protein [Peribacillus simplex]|nr:hypothetical protein [Peribacillus simplex]WHY55958.1 hypothetical protein QNH43_22900 [Peribacillus simplex]